MNDKITPERTSRTSNLKEFVESIGDYFGPYPDLNGHSIVSDSREALRNQAALTAPAPEQSHIRVYDDVFDEGMEDLVDDLSVIMHGVQGFKPDEAQRQNIGRVIWEHCQKQAPAPGQSAVEAAMEFFRTCPNITWEPEAVEFLARTITTYAQQKVTEALATSPDLTTAYMAGYEKAKDEAQQVREDAVRPLLGVIAACEVALKEVQRADEKGDSWNGDTIQNALFAATAALTGHPVATKGDKGRGIEKLTCPVCQGLGEIDFPHRDKRAETALKQRMAKTLVDAGYSFRQVARFVGYNSPNSVSFAVKKVDAATPVSSEAGGKGGA